MDITIFPRKLSGTIQAIPSKSQAHRILICAAFSDKPTAIRCPATNNDIDATVDCLNALGAKIVNTQDGFLVTPVQAIPSSAVLNCRESGATLRFMLPICAALGVDATFLMAGRLPSRPLSPLWEELTAKGCVLSRPDASTIRCQGKLQSGNYTIDGGISSQFITGLMFALALLPGDSQLHITGKVESKPYIDMTLSVLESFGAETDGVHFGNLFPFHSPGQITVEGDWSNGAFFVAAAALGNDVNITGLDPKSSQGDRAIRDLAEALNQNITISGEDIPDLIPILAVIAGAKQGATFENIGRLRLKESDRIESVRAMLTALQVYALTGENWIQVSPGLYEGCTIDAGNDHRIAMSAAIAATVAHGPVTILGAECVNKSYPDFWSDYAKLGGYYEQHIR